MVDMLDIEDEEEEEEEEEEGLTRNESAMLGGGGGTSGGEARTSGRVVCLFVRFPASLGVLALLLRVAAMVSKLRRIA